MAPDNMVYDNSARTYIRRSAFDPLFLKPDVSRHLSQLRSIADGILDQTVAWIGQSLSYDAVSTPVRNVDAKNLRSVSPRSGGSRQSGASANHFHGCRRVRRANAGPGLRVDNGRLKHD